MLVTPLSFPQPCPNFRLPSLAQKHDGNATFEFQTLLNYGKISSSLSDVIGKTEGTWAWAETVLCLLDDDLEELEEVDERRPLPPREDEDLVLGLVVGSDSSSTVSEMGA